MKTMTRDSVVTWAYCYQAVLKLLLAAPGVCNLPVPPLGSTGSRGGLQWKRIDRAPFSRLSNGSCERVNRVPPPVFGHFHLCPAT